MFLGVPDHFVVLFLAAEEIIIDLAQQWQLPIQIVPLLCPVCIEGVIRAPPDLIGIKFEELLKDFDAVFDTVGGETTDKSFQVLKRGGILVSMLGQPNPDLAQKYGVTVIGQMTKTDATHLTRLAELVDSGKIKISVDKVFPLEQVKEAFQYQEEVHPRGKVVLKIKE